MQVFAPYAGVVSRFVLGPLMRSAPVKGSAAAADPKAGRVWGHVSLHIKLRAQALKVAQCSTPLLDLCDTNLTDSRFTV